MGGATTLAEVVSGKASERSGMELSLEARGEAEFQVCC